MLEGSQFIRVLRSNVGEITTTTLEVRRKPKNENVVPSNDTTEHEIGTKICERRNLGAPKLLGNQADLVVRSGPRLSTVRWYLKRHV